MELGCDGLRREIWFKMNYLVVGSIGSGVGETITSLGKATKPGKNWIYGMRLLLRLGSLIKFYSLRDFWCVEGKQRFDGQA